MKYWKLNLLTRHNGRMVTASFCGRSMNPVSKHFVESRLQLVSNTKGDQLPNWNAYGVSRKMTDEQNVTQWLDLLKAGEKNATTQLWNEFFGRLLSLARKKLMRAPRRVADEEDVALSAFHSFCRGAAEGRFQKLDDRDDLWQVLAIITTRKAGRQIQKNFAKKRGDGQVRGESVFGQDGDNRFGGIQEAATGGPSPEFQVIANEEFEALLDRLPDDSIREIAFAKLEGYTNQEIADRLGRHVRSIERKLQLIRKYWESDDDDQ